MPPPRSSESESEPNDVSVPDHQLIHRIGRGSYGEVWLARNLMGVYRAVKVVYRKSFDTERPFERELEGIRKFEPISRSHESFVQILHVGSNEADGYFYYVMELGDDVKTGQTIHPDLYVPNTLGKQVALRRRVPLEESVQMGLSLSAALHHLHTHGLVHRDVKPSNVIFVNGIPKLADIGLVARIDEARSYVGTEGFIPPEGPGAPQGDVYGLGKVLYEISTGKDRHDFPELPTLLDSTASLDRFLELNEVILNACRSNTKERYQTAGDMHADLVVLANGKSVKRLKLLERRFANLKRIAGVSGIAAIVLAAVLFLIYREWNFVQEDRQRQIGAKVAHGTRAMDDGDLLKATPSFSAALALDQRNGERARTHRTRLRAVFAQAPKLVQMWFGKERINGVPFDPDGKRVLVIEMFEQARILDAESGELSAQAFGAGQGLNGGSWHPSGKWIATANYNKTVCIWELDKKAPLFELKHPDKVYMAVFSPDGSRIVTACVDGIARLWNFNTRIKELELGEPEHHTGAVLHATFSHDGKLVATASKDKTARIWDAITGTQLGSDLKHGDWVNYVSFSPDDRRVITAGADHTASVWEVRGCRKVLPVLNHGDAVMSAEFSPDGLMILTACLDGQARLWDAISMQPLRLNSTLWQSGGLLHAAFASDGHRIALASSDGTVSVWDLAGGIVTPASANGKVCEDGTHLLVTSTNTFQVWETASMTSLTPPIPLRWPMLDAQISANGKSVLTVAVQSEGTRPSTRLAQVWDYSSATGHASEMTLTNGTTRVSLSSDGRHLILIDGNEARLWSTLEGRSVGIPMVHQKLISGAKLSPGGRHLALCGGNLVSLWDALSGERIGEPFRHSLAVSLARFSPDGLTLVTACNDTQLTLGAAQIRETRTGKTNGPPLAHLRDGIVCAAYSRDGHRLITGGEDFSAVVWDASTGAAIARMKHRRQVLGVAFSPDGIWVATTAADGTARVWDAATGEPVTPLLDHPTRRLKYVGFSADGQTLVTTDERGKTWFWSLHPDQRPIEDLSLLSQLLTGFQSGSSIPLSPPLAAERAAIWQRLRAAYPEDFIVPEANRVAWHLRFAQLAEDAQLWDALIFHLKRLLKLDPNNSALRDRLIQTQAWFEMEPQR